MGANSAGAEAVTWSSQRVSLASLSRHPHARQGFVSIQEPVGGLRHDQRRLGVNNQPTPQRGVVATSINGKSILGQVAALETATRGGPRRVVAMWRDAADPYSTAAIARWCADRLGEPAPSENEPTS